MAKKKKDVQEADAEEDNVKIVPDGYIGDISQALYWEWRCSVSEKNLAKQKHENALLMHRLLSLQIEKQKSDLKVYQFSTMADSQKELDHAESEFSSTKKKMADLLGQPIEGCIINEAFQVLKPDGLHGSVS